jgi:hypothetical protein
MVPHSLIQRLDEQSIMTHLTIILTVVCLYIGRIISVSSLAFGSPLQLANLFNAMSNNNSDTKSKFSYTHLEGNGQLWEATNGNTKVSVEIDPIASQLLGFGIPWGYRGNKIVYRKMLQLMPLSNDHGIR